MQAHICYLIVTFLAFLPLTVSAKPTPAKASDFLTAEQIKIEFKKITQPTLLKGDFQQTKTIKELQMKIETAGHFQVTKLNADQAFVLWEIVNPEKVKVCIDTTQIIYENIKLNKKTVLKKSDMNELENPSLGKLIELIKLDPDRVAANFNIQKLAGQFLITPKEGDKSFFSLAEMSLNAQKNITLLRLTEVNEDSLEIRFTHLNEKTLKPADIKQSVCQ